MNMKSKESVSIQHKKKLYFAKDTKENKFKMLHTYKPYLSHESSSKNMYKTVVGLFVIV